MCTALLDLAPDASWPVLLLGTRDEFTDRPWAAPSQWWPRDHGDVVGGLDHEAGGSWFAVNARQRRAAMVFNALDPPALTERTGWDSRGRLPLLAADGQRPPGRDELRRTRAFKLLQVSGSSAHLMSWDGREVRHEAIAPGTHLIDGTGVDTADGRAARWLPRLRACRRPAVGLHGRAEERWGSWLELLRDDRYEDPAGSSVVVRERVGERTHATLALSAVAVGPALRFDFASAVTAGDLDRLEWQRVV
ncbi:NRDE family protein [Streptomyces solisilvae]|uniref:NRDE family protein n=1 Tax=Streptomyces malaysiensis TaxID=92644 RepID=UPI0036A1EDF7